MDIYEPRIEWQELALELRANDNPLPLSVACRVELDRLVSLWMDDNN